MRPTQLAASCSASDCWLARPDASGCLAWQGRSNCGNFRIVISITSLEALAMTGDADKSRKYLRWAAANERRAACAHDEELKTMFLRVAAQYHKLAQMNDPAGEVAAKQKE